MQKNSDFLLQQCLSGSDYVLKAHELFGELAMFGVSGAF
jgi:hypothetical protein